MAGMGDNIDAQTEVFGQYQMGLNQTQQMLSKAMQDVSGQANAPAATGSLTESAAFFKQEQQARSALAQFMSNTADGLVGYQQASGSIGQLYNQHIQADVQTMNALLQPRSGPAPIVRELAPPIAPTPGG